MKLLTVRHATTYRYSAPVSFGQHRLMLRPRDSHDLRLVGAELALSPPGKVRWLHDVFSNSVALVDFAAPAAQLSIVSTLTLERYALARLDFPIAPEAEHYPFMYSADDRSDLGRLSERHYPDPQGIVAAWARQFVLETPANSFDLLASMNAAIRGAFEYRAREEEGTQTPLETLERQSGTCRDYALLFIEAARALGFGARFVTGYLYDPALDGGAAVQGAVEGAGATHAWAEIYLPGAGWVEFGPTNALVAGENLIRVAVTRDPSQAVPIGGTFAGEEGVEAIGIEVDVTVHAEAR
ncbi:MAG TPA: transglutaminase family protein [Xanthobacteraceae bacterium]|nr:transglutaminase family protein [Xanthobacteraceae bacterium]